MSQQSVRVRSWLRSNPLHALVLALLGLTLLSLQAGAVPIGLSDWLAPFRQQDDATLTGGAWVLWHLRMPRLLLGICVGAMLGACGALTQGLFRNPLADPGLLGVQSGAACAVALILVGLGSLGLALPDSARFWTIPAAAFTGGLAVCVSLDRLARWLTAGSIAGLLLTGVALNAIAGSVIGLCTYLATDEQLRSLTFWTLGSLAGANWHITLLGIGLLLAAMFLMRELAGHLNVLALGEQVAAHVGVDVRMIRQRTVLIVALLGGFSVASCGMIGFIGLIAPHIVRTLYGADQRVVVPLSMLLGACLLLTADTLARVVAVPAEVPVGIFTSLMGAPFFLLLLQQMRKAGWA
ncbi:iron ABC transporter permease [Burkholderiaceae bacterium DAT-1]|nr:iron ABC transporter permease [Burkholderiaceae bacterium DAT-1]